MEVCRKSRGSRAVEKTSPQRWHLDSYLGEDFGSGPKNTCLRFLNCGAGGDSWTARRSNQSILKEINPEYSLEGLMLKLQYFGHHIQRASSLEKTLMLRKTEGRRRRGRPRMRWLDGITDSKDMLLLLSRFSRVQLCATPQMAAHQAPSALGFSSQERWSGLPFPSPTHESEEWKWSRSVMSDS